MSRFRRSHNVLLGTVATVVLVTVSMILAPRLSFSQVISPYLTFLPFISSVSSAPQPTPIPTTPPAPVPSPATVVVKSSTEYPPTSDLRPYTIYGEIYNGSTTNVYATKVTARFYDHAQRLLATESNWTFLAKTAPGHLNPFMVRLSAAPAGITRYTLEVTGRTSLDVEYYPATVMSQQVRPKYPTENEVYGELRNEQSFDLKGVVVVATFYDARGTVVGADMTMLDGSQFPPGTSRDYALGFPIVERQPYTTFAVQAQGYEKASWE